MNSARLEHLAKAAGLSIDWIDVDGREQRVSPEVLRAVLNGLGIDADSDAAVANSLKQLNLDGGYASLPPLLTVDQGSALELAHYCQPGESYWMLLDNEEQLVGRLDQHACLPPVDRPGYHRLEIAGRQLTLAVAPSACPSVRDIAGPSAWGVALQLYGLRREGDGGLGDTLALEEFVRHVAQHGADAVGISPVHAMFAAYGNHYSPYSPSSRLLYNVLHASPEAILGERAVQIAIEACGLTDELRRLEQLELIDWTAVGQARQCLLRQLFENFCKGGNALQVDFDSFRATGGEALENHCRFEALHATLLSPNGHPQHWRDWPAAYRHPNNAEVERFAREHAHEVSYHAFCQWLVARGLERAQIAARSAGMKIGLISDLAVGADGGGSQAWSRQEAILAALSVGAPPDILNRAGQNWGICAFSPWGLRASGYQAFIEMVRANLAHAGGMRIDHVMGLMRLWVIPEGASPENGTYLNYPFDDLLRLLTLEAWRHNVVILGEDLGTVPAGLREKLAARNILGMRVLLFEQEHGHFHPPAQWASEALATTTTHDLPTLAGWWLGRDIAWRIRTGQCAEEDRHIQLTDREQERRGLESVLRPYARTAARPLTAEDALQASACFIGHTPAPLVLLPLEDALGLEEQPNLPGVVDHHPNWQRRYPGNSATLLDDSESTRRLHCLAVARRNLSGGDTDA